MAQHEFVVRYSEPIVRSSVKRYFLYLLRREMSWGGYVAVAALIGIFVYSLVRANASWFVGAVGAVLVLLGILLVCAYRAHLSQALERLRLMKEPTAKFTVTDEALTISFDGGSSTVPWHQFSTILENDECWVFVLKQRSIFTLPLAGVDDSALRLIRERVASHAGAV